VENICGVTGVVASLPSSNSQCRKAAFEPNEHRLGERRSTINSLLFTASRVTVAISFCVLRNSDIVNDAGTTQLDPADTESRDE